MLVGGGFLFVRALPPRQIPNFKTAAAADECDLAFQAQLLAKIFRQNEPALVCPMRRARRANAVGAKRCGDRAPKRSAPIRRCELMRSNSCVRHDQEKLVVRFGENDEILALARAPA